MQPRYDTELPPSFPLSGTPVVQSSWARMLEEEQEGSCICQANWRGGANQRETFGWFGVVAEMRFICGLRVGARGLEPPQRHPGKRDLLGASEWPTLFCCSLENEHTFPRPLKSLSGASESLSGALRVSETPNC